MHRDSTREVRIKDRVIGGGNPVLIQSMTNTRTEDVAATVAQIHELEAAGCEIVRCTVPTAEAAKALGEKLKEGQVELSMKTGEGGKVFGSVSSKEIAAAAEEQLGLKIDKKKIQLKEQIKSLGVHNVPVKLHPKVTAELKVWVKEEV